MHYCVVKGCNNRSGKSSAIKFYSFPLKNKQLLQKWLQIIPLKCENVNVHTRICSAHFTGGIRRKDDIPNIFPTQPVPKQTGRKEIVRAVVTPRKWPKVITKVRHDHTYAAPQCDSERDEVTSSRSQSHLTVISSKDILPRCSELADMATNTDSGTTRDAFTETNLPHTSTSTQTDTGSLYNTEGNHSENVGAVCTTRDVGVEANCNPCFSIEQIQDNKTLVQFYTGFADFETFKIAFTFLGEAVYCLRYWGNSNTGSDHILDSRGAPRKLTPMNEFLLVLCRLRCGLLEIDLAHRFGISQSTVSRILITWINFLYFKFKDLNIWPTKEQIQMHLPKQFKEKYPTTRCVIDATEVYIQMPSNPTAQQLTFSSYKNHNTFKALVVVTPTGAISFVSSLYGGSISDRELTIKSGLLNLLQPGDSVMADKGFTITDLLYDRGVELNIPPLKTEDQLSEDDIILTRRIASLRIHVERAIGRIKTFRILNDVPINMAPLADQIFFVCAMLSNFSKPLCS